MVIPQGYKDSIDLNNHFDYEPSGLLHYNRIMSYYNNNNNNNNNNSNNNLNNNYFEGGIYNSELTKTILNGKVGINGTTDQNKTQTLITTGTATTRRQRFTRDGRLTDEPSICELGWFEMIQGLVFGDAPQTKIILDEYQSELSWAPFIMLEAFFNSISAITLVSNPYSGLLIFISMALSNPNTSLIASLSLISGLLTSLIILRLPLHLIRSGGVTFNSMLTGIAIGEMAKNSGFDIIGNPDIILTAIASGSLVIFIWGGLNGLLSRLDISLLNSPFNLMTVIYFTSGWVSLYTSTPQEREPVDEEYYAEQFALLNIHVANNTGLKSEQDILLNNSNAVEVFGLERDFVNWVRVLKGVILSFTQIYGTSSLFSSALVYAAVFLYSPILCAQFITGCFIGSIIGVGITSINKMKGLNYNLVYRGIWGYNSQLTCGALGGLFLYPNIHSQILALVGAVSTALVSAAFILNGKQMFGIPFMAVTWLFLLVNFNTNVIDQKQSSASPSPNSKKRRGSLLLRKNIIKVPLNEISTPEKHRKILKDKSHNKILP